MDLALEDLRPLAGRSGRFLTLLLPAPSHHADAAERFAIQRKTALKSVSTDWPADDLQALDDELAALPHDAGAGLIVVRSSHGDSLTEFIDDPVEAAVFEGRYPRLAPPIQSRQCTIAHVVVEADLAGANLTAFDGGDVLATGVVEGETEYIHRGHAGGWSQRRFQQRAENTWRRTPTMWPMRPTARQPCPRPFDRRRRTGPGSHDGGEVAQRHRCRSFRCTPAIPAGSPTRWSV